MAEADWLKKVVLVPNSNVDRPLDLSEKSPKSSNPSTPSSLTHSQQRSSSIPEVHAPLPKVSKPNVVNRLIPISLRHEFKPFLAEYCEDTASNIQDFNSYLQITKVVEPVVPGGKVVLYLSDGEKGIVAKLPLNFYEKVPGGKLKAFDIVKIARASGHSQTGDLTIVS